MNKLIFMQMPKNNINPNSTCKVTYSARFKALNVVQQFDFGDYTITEYDNGRVWLNHWTGEGFEMTEGNDLYKTLRDIIHLFFKVNM